jgi:membrane protease YdiL (CAAX protease family)
MNRNSKKAILFIGLSYSVSWLMAILFFTFGGKWMTPGSVVMAVVYMFVPTVVAIIVQKFIYKEAVKEPLGISFRLNRWFIVAWLLPLLIAIAAAAVSIVLPGAEFVSAPEGSRVFEHFRTILPAETLQQMERQISSLPFHPFWFVLLQGVVAGITINAVAGFGEELGWRGFLQKEFGYMGFWKSSAVIGVVWGIWHAPLVLKGHDYPQHPVAGVFMMVILCVLLAPIFSYVRLKAKSVVAAAIIHGTFNATAILPLIVVRGGSDLIIGVTGLAGLIVLFFVNLCLFLYDRVFSKEPVVV